MKIFLFLALVVLTNLLAQDFQMIGSLRERFEILDGMNKKNYGEQERMQDNSLLKGDAHDKLLVSRLQLGFVYKQTSDIIYTVLGYYASVYGWSLNNDDFKKRSGSETYWMNPQEDLDFTDLNVKVKNIANVQGLSLKIGREPNNYGDKRILGPGSWGNSYGWLWDLAKISYQFNGNFVDVFYGQTKDKNLNRLSLFHKHVYAGAGIYTHFKIANKGAFEPFVIYKDGLYKDAGNGQNSEISYTYGLRVYDKMMQGFHYDFTFAKTDGTIKEKNYDAYGYAVKVGYQFKNMKMHPDFVIGRVYASGDDNPNDNTNKTFRTPFGGTDGSLTVEWIL